MLHYLQKHQYIFLIVFTILTLFLHPFLQTATHGDLIFHILLSCVLLAGTRSAWDHQQLITLSIFLWITSLLLNRADFRISETAFTLLYSLTAFLFFLVVTLKVLHSIIDHQKVSLHTILWSIAGYMMLGMAGAFLFNVIEALSPWSFSTAVTQVWSWISYLYYSFVTMLTIGYWDVVPVWAHAQTRSVLLAIAGQLYLTVLIWVLIGKYVRDK